jgi:hypothetical protein
MTPLGKLTLLEKGTQKSPKRHSNICTIIEKHNKNNVV